MRFLPFFLLLLATPAAADVSPFKMPSGNIECYIAQGEAPPDLRCMIFDRSGPPAAPRPASCQGPWGHIFILLPGGRVQMECGSPGPANTAPGVEVAAYGQTADWGGIKCQSSTTGLECRNADGHGFFLSRARQSLF